MCGYCGCGQIEVQTHQHTHKHRHDYEHAQRIVQIERDILAENQRFAEQNRDFLQRKNSVAFNLVSSPGSGKTTLLTKTILALKNIRTMSVIEGDQQTDLDRQRIAQTGVPVRQINTGKSCHLDAHQVGHALAELPLENNSLLFIENVGNLVCPALFDLGETCKVVILSVTEGDDKPLKYPYMFDQSTLMIINKIDLLPYVSFDMNQCIEYARRIHPAIEVLQLSATTGAGMTKWCDWLTKASTHA